MISAPKAGQAITLYRAVYEDYENDPLPSRSAAGRFHDEETTGQVSYLAARPETAWAEVLDRWMANRGAFRMAEVAVTLHVVVDLTDPATRRRYGIERAMLTADDYHPCQQLRKRLEAEGVEAMWTYSRADQPNGRQMVVLLGRLKRGSTVEVIRTGPITV